MHMRKVANIQYFHLKIRFMDQSQKRWIVSLHALTTPAQALRQIRIRTRTLMAIRL